MQVIARSNQAACHSFFTVRRVGMVAARRSTALRFTRSPAMTSRSSGMPELRSSVRNGRAGMARNRSERARAFMAGRCESPPEMSTRDGQPGAHPARLDRFGLLRPRTLLFFLGCRREQRGDLLTERAVTRRRAGLAQYDAAECEGGIRRRGPVDERFDGAEIAGWTVGIARLRAEIGGLPRIARRVRRDVAPQTLEADRTLAAGRPLAGLRRVSDVTMIQMQHHGRLNLITGV